MDPPNDGDDIAKVTPLRRRDGQLVAVPTVRDPLPAEGSVWDTGEVDEPRLRRSRLRRLRNLSMLGWRRFRFGLVELLPRPAISAGIVLICVVAGTAATLLAGSARTARPHETVLSSLSPRTSSSAATSTPADRTGRPSAEQKTEHRAQRVVRHPRVTARSRHPARTHSSVHLTTAPTTAAPPTTTTASTTAPSTPAAGSAAAASAASTSQLVHSTTPAGPSGSGAAFGPGY